MRVVYQRVVRAQVRVAGEVVGEIDRGALVLVGAAKGDVAEDVSGLVEKVVHLRVFADPPGAEDGKGMNRSLLEVGGGLLVVSQFTLLGDARKGRRPSFTEALPPDEARLLVDAFVAGARAAGVRPVAEGRFGADMAVELVNDGPVTILLDSRRLF